MSFAQTCLGHDPVAYRQHEAAVAEAIDRIQRSGVDMVRLGWCDLHGVVRAKALTVPAAVSALRSGLGMVGTLALKDGSDRTAFKVFEAGGAAAVPGFEGGGNMVLLPDPTSFRVLPWVGGTGWLRCDAWFQDGTPVGLDTRRILQRALARLAACGYGMACGLEVEFHIYRLNSQGPEADPLLADWPGPAPAVSLLHPGFHMLSDAWLDMAEPALRIVRDTAQGLGLPLTSLEVEMGPSQVEAVFDVTDALTAADHMVLFRNGVRQALRRAGYHATFMCRPPFARIMSSGWHLHQSLVSLADGTNAFVRQAPAPGTHAGEATHTLSDVGAAWLAGLLAHAHGMAALCVPTLNGFARFQPNALAPCAAVWGRDNRGAMLRVVGAAQDRATRIENRLGEPAANPYLYMAAQIHAGLEGLLGGRTPPLATDSPYATADAGNGAGTRLPTSMAEALTALSTDAALCQGLGEDWVRYYTQVKQADLARYAQCADPLEFDRREYFSRI